MSDSEDAVEILHTMRAQSNSDRNPATATSAARRTKRPHKPLPESPDTEPSAQKKPRPSTKASKESSKPKQVSQASEIKKLRKNIASLEKTGESLQAQLDEKEEEIKVLKKKVKHQASLLKEGSELVLQKDLKRANDKILTLEGRFAAVVEGKKASDATGIQYQRHIVALQRKLSKVNEENGKLHGQLNFYKATLDADKEKKKLREQRALASHREAIRRETKQKEQQSKAEQKQKETQEKQTQVQFLRQQAMPGGGMMGMPQQPTYGNMFNAGHVINPQSYMQQQFQQQQQQQQQQRQQNSMEAMVPMMAEMIQQALATAGIGNSRSTMAGPNGTVVQAPTQAPTQAPMRNDTNAYLPHGQIEVPTLLLSDLHGEEEEEGNTGNTGNNEESFSVLSPVFSPYRGQPVVDTQAATSDSSFPVKLQVFSQQSNPVSDGEEGS